MQNELIEKMTEAQRTSYTMLQELSEVNTKVVKDLTELQLGWAAYSIEKGVEFTKLFGDATSYADLLNAETEFADQYATNMMELGRKTVDILTESRDEVAAWFEKTVDSTSREAKTKEAKKPGAKRSNSKTGHSKTAA